MEHTAPAPAATTVSLPEDIVREILLRVGDAAALYRCSATCRRWNGLVADASFLRRRWPPKNRTSSFLIGFFTMTPLALADPATATSLISTPRLGFGLAGRRFLDSFFPSAGGLLDDAVPLAARRGLLLVRLASPEDGGVRLAMCNLLTGACDMLPPLEFNWKFEHKFEEGGYAIVTGEDYSLGDKQQPLSTPGSSAFIFKVIIIGSLGPRRPINLRTFSSGESRWRAFHYAGFAYGGISWPLRHPTPVVTCGTAHWLAWCTTAGGTGLHTLDLDVETHLVSLTKIAIPDEHINSKTHDKPHLSVTAGGKLLLLHMRRPGLRLDIWTRQDDGRWFRSHVKLKLPKKHANAKAAGAVYLSLLGENGGMLLVKENNGQLCAVDLETNVMEELMECGRIARQKVVPFEMDCLGFFTSRLVGSRPVASHA